MTSTWLSSSSDEEESSTAVTLVSEEAQAAPNIQSADTQDVWASLTDWGFGENDSDSTSSYEEPDVEEGVFEEEELSEEEGVPEEVLPVEVEVDVKVMSIAAEKERPPTTILAYLGSKDDLKGFTAYAEESGLFVDGVMRTVFATVDAADELDANPLDVKDEDKGKVVALVKGQAILGVVSKETIGCSAKFETLGGPGKLVYVRTRPFTANGKSVIRSSPRLTDGIVHVVGGLLHEVAAAEARLASLVRPIQHVALSSPTTEHGIVFPSERAADSYRAVHAELKPHMHNPGAHFGAMKTKEHGDELVRQVLLHVSGRSRLFKRNTAPKEKISHAAGILSTALAGARFPEVGSSLGSKRAHEASFAGFAKDHTEATVRFMAGRYRGSTGLESRALVDMSHATEHKVELAVKDGIFDEEEGKKFLAALRQADQLTVQEFVSAAAGRMPIVNPDLAEFYAGMPMGAPMGADSDNLAESRRLCDVALVPFLAKLYDGEQAGRSEWTKGRVQTDKIANALFLSGETEDWEEMRAATVYDAYKSGELIDLRMVRESRSQVDLEDPALYDRFDVVTTGGPKDTVRICTGRKKYVMCHSAMTVPVIQVQTIPVERHMETVPVACKSVRQDDDWDYAPLCKEFAAIAEYSKKYPTADARRMFGKAVAAAAVASLLQIGEEENVHVLACLATAMILDVFQGLISDHTTVTPNVLGLVNDMSAAMSKMGVTLVTSGVGKKVPPPKTIAKMMEASAKSGYEGNLGNLLVESVLHGPWKNAKSAKFVSVKFYARNLLQDTVHSPDALFDILYGILQAVSSSLFMVSTGEANFIVAEWDSAAKYIKTRTQKILPSRSSDDFLRLMGV